LTFTLFLRITVAASSASAAILGSLALAGAASSDQPQVLLFGGAWWLTAAMVGLVIGRGAEASRAISTLLAQAETSRSLPELRPARTLLNRLWPLLLATLGAATMVVVAPQITAVAAGFAIIWSLSWRRQEAAVRAIEGRDGVRFFVARTSPIGPIKLSRTPWFATEDGFPTDA